MSFPKKGKSVKIVEVHYSKWSKEKGIQPSESRLKELVDAKIVSYQLPKGSRREMCIAIRLSAFLSV